MIKYSKILILIGGSIQMNNLYLHKRRSQFLTCTSFMKNNFINYFKLYDYFDKKFLKCIRVLQLSYCA